MKRPELLAPAATHSMVAAAAQGGASAVYFGLSALNMRKGAKNFDIGQLPKTVDYCRSLGLKCYLTLNTIVFDDEVAKVNDILDAAAKVSVDAVIAWDPSVIMEARARDLEVHLSTQASVANTAAARFWKEQGISRVILARECSLEQVAQIKRDSGVEVECFVHGAMCLALSGRCLLSHYTTSCSGNRGQCVQPCRREYEIRDVETGDKYKVGDNYVLSPRDLCALPFIDLLIQAGIDCFKIEGRNRSPEYVRTVTSSYSEAITAVLEGSFEQQLIDELRQRMTKVYNRNFSDGFYFGLPAHGGWAGNTGSAATHRKVFIGRVKKYYKKISVAVVKLENRHLAIGDDVILIGPKTGVVHLKIPEIEIEHQKVERAEKGTLIAVKTDTRWRPGDKLFILEPVVPLTDQ